MPVILQSFGRDRSEVGWCKNSSFLWGMSSDRACKRDCMNLGSSFLTKMPPPPSPRAGQSKQGKAKARQRQKQRQRQGNAQSKAKARHGTATNKRTTEVPAIARPPSVVLTTSSLGYHLTLSRPQHNPDRPDPTQRQCSRPHALWSWREQQ